MDVAVVVRFSLLIVPALATATAASVAAARRWVAWPFGAFLLSSGGLFGYGVGAFIRQSAETPNTFTCGMPLVGLIGVIGAEFATVVALSVVLVAIRRTRRVGLSFLVMSPLVLIAAALAAIYAAKY